MPPLQGDAHPNAVTVWDDHGLEVVRKVVPIVDSVLSDIGCVSEHREVVTEAIG